ncbi:MAG: hypothetical protein ACOH2T_29345, partial [Pseudomonas sp.]
MGQFSIGVNNNFQQSTLEPSGHVRPVPGSFGSDFVDGHPDQSASRLPLRRQITPSILLTIYIYSYLNRIKAGRSVLRLRGIEGLYRSPKSPASLRLR